MKLLIISIFLSFFLSESHSSTIQSFCEKSEISRFAIRQRGRVKPLYVHAKEVINYMTSKSKKLKMTPVAAYCLLSLSPLNNEFSLQIKTKVEHKKTRDFLGMDKNEDSISMDLLAEKTQDLRFAMIKEKDEGVKKDIQKNIGKINFYNSIILGEDWLVPVGSGANIKWLPITSLLSMNDINEGKAFKKLKQFETEFKANTPNSKHQLEYTLNILKLPKMALAISLLALVFLVLFKKFHIALGLTGLTLLVQLSLIIIRVIISGRAPITNMYETVLFSGFGSLVLAAAIGHLKNEKIFIFIGLAYNSLTLMMINFANGMLTESISPLVPVLRDNFWLSTHVTSIILSYGALALSWVLANTVLFKGKFGTLSKKDLKYYTELIYTCLKFGVVLLAGGILLGGVWADYSWGRFWGWDPKETWSLIVLCIYIAILHGKQTSWISAERFVPLVAAAFLSVMMAWFGVNYILAVGLHSYGFSQGGAIFLGSFFTVQVAILLLTMKGPKLT